MMMSEYMKSDIAKKLDFDSSLTEEFNLTSATNSSDVDMEESFIHEDHPTNNNNYTPNLSMTPKMSFTNSSPLDFPTFRSRNLFTCTPKVQPNKPNVNLNPFTPTGMILVSKKRTRSRLSNLESSHFSDIAHDLDSDSDQENTVPTKRLSLQEANINRYHKEFHEICLLGSGEFGSVYKCLNRLDGCLYAIKKNIKPVNLKMAMNEVYAHAVLGKHEYVVRYYSAWSEDDHLIIQNEFCNGGSLADQIEKNRINNTPFTESQLQTMLTHLAYGLKYIHYMKLIHMDIKPANIFISIEPRMDSLNYESADDGFEEDENASCVNISNSANSDNITFKIGDLGHVTSVKNPEVEEGDCRYLPDEILQENFKHLPKADIFALGLTLYEAAGGGPLPKNGNAWHEIRRGNIPVLERYSKKFYDLIKLMIHPDPERRPTAAALLQHSYLCPSPSKSIAQLQRELSQEKQKNKILSERLEETSKIIKCLHYSPKTMHSISHSPKAMHSSHSPIRHSKSARFIGKMSLRSHSNANF